MSHFTVLVCVSPERLARHNGAVEDAVAELMAPYQENNMGDCPEEYLEFNETETEYLEQYENDTSPRVKCPDGTMVYPWDERFRVKGSIGTGSGTHQVPEGQGYEELDVPLKEMYSTFEEYMEDYCGYSERDPKTGKYGYWENPSKWDYWRIGGRWSGTLYVKPGTEQNLTLGRWDSPTEVKENTSDICQVKELDIPRIEKDMRERAEKFWNEFAEFRKTGETPVGSDPFYNVRSRSMDVGLLDVVRDPEEGKKRGGVRWGDVMPHLQEDDSRRDWYDVINQDVTKEEFLSEWVGHYCPIRTYAALDDDGWHEPGRMGWFGCSSADSESRNEYGKVFMDKFVYEKDPETVLAVCDCHI